MKRPDNATIIIGTVALLVGLLAGGLIFGFPKKQHESEHLHTEATEIIGETIWTCSMHPQIRQQEPGDCPICGMDLIPLESDDDGDSDPDAVKMSQTAIKLAGVTTIVVSSEKPVKEMRLSGKVVADQRLVYSQSSHIPGRIEELKVNFTGEFVKAGQTIGVIYSPELVTAQQELLEAKKIKSEQPGLFSAAMEKLKNLKLSNAQIDAIMESGQVTEKFPVKSDISGYVTSIGVSAGDYIKTGHSIYEITDLSRVWVMFDLYESDIAWIDRGDSITFTVSSFPGETFSGTVSYIDPVIDSQTRIARARVELENSKLKLKPEMFTTGISEAMLNDGNEVIVVPGTAVMWTGKRSLVYVKSESESGISFKMREVKLGPWLGDSYVITAGLQEGEEIAVNGTFSIDAAAQLAGKPGMMNPEGGAVSTGHDHGSMSGTTSSNALSAESGGEIKELNVSEEFRVQFTAVYNAYLEMKNAFVNSDTASVRSNSSLVKSAIEKSDMTLLSGDAHMLWMDHMEKLVTILGVIEQSDDIEKQRHQFALLNTLFYHTVKSFGLSGQVAYYQYCPMAENDSGAFWLSETEEIRNPYFGDMMLKCGENREIIK
jgi:Cu(I)/Ag(I) efflux system membrane fusion protein